MASYLMFPSAEEFEVPTTKVRLSLSVKIELLDIYHYLKVRQGDIRPKVSQGSFGFLIGCHLPKSTLSEMLRSEAKLRAASETLPDREEAESAETATPAGLAGEEEDARSNDPLDEDTGMRS